jgi:hypothetical protein
MTKRNILRTVAGTLFLWGAAIAVEQTRGVASCTPESGFTGLMHKALFAPTANCSLSKNGKKCASPGSACSFKNASGKPTAGTCTDTNNGCACQ